MIRLALAALLALWATLAAAEVEIEEVTSPGGIDAWLVETREIPFVALEVRIRGGANLDLPGKRGATNLMVALLEEGAGDMDAQAFQTAREALAASYDFDVYDDSFALSVQALTENRDAAMALLRQALIEPRFDQDAIDRVRAQVIAGIRSEANDPNDIANAAFDAAAFGDHPYGSDLDGTIESVTALTRDDIVEAHARVLTRDRIHVGAVGDITADELGALLDKLFAGLPAEGPTLPERAEFALQGGISVIDYDTPQSVALFGHTGMARDDPDFFAAFILNEILGGSGLGSRLMTEVREERGLTYGVYSYLLPRDHAELYLGSVASANDRIAEAIEVIRDEWRRLAEEGVTAEELQDAKTFLTGAYPLRFDGNGRIASILVGMQMIDLPVDYIATRNANVEAVTLEEINRVAAELLRPDALHFTVVGKPEGLETTTN